MGTDNVSFGTSAAHTLPFQCRPDSAIPEPQQHGNPLDHVPDESQADSLLQG
jgi:hypothetical protein